jgi:hypothetical protein
MPCPFSTFGGAKLTFSQHACQRRLTRPITQGQFQVEGVHVDTAPVVKYLLRNFLGKEEGKCETTIEMLFIKRTMVQGQEAKC